MTPLLTETAERLFADHVDKQLLDAAEAGEFPHALWTALRETGFHRVGAAGSGTGLAEVFGLLRVAGRYAVPLPLAEMLLAGALPGGRGEDADAGFTTIAASGVAPWGRAARWVLTVEGQVGERDRCEHGANLAGEPRDSVTIRASRPVAAACELPALLALSRAVLIAGALERLLALSVEYAKVREQFGRPIAKFQAIQHSLAALAGEVAAAGCACDGAIAALPTPQRAQQIAVAKARAGEAAGVGAAIAHQVHGAVGFTHECDLHHYTRRLLAWRDEHGRESEWQERLGRRIAARPDAVWDALLGR